MKFILTISIFCCLSINFNLKGQSEDCSKIKIVSIYDFPPTAATPGGNFFLLLLTVTEDLEVLSPFYADLFFVDQEGDTISYRLGPSNTLPMVKSDTIPYIMELAGEANNQDFPTDFDGKLIIESANSINCALAYSNTQTLSNNHVLMNREIVVYPNPFKDVLTIESEKMIRNIIVINSIGQVIRQEDVNDFTYQARISGLNESLIFLIIRFDDNTEITKRIIYSK